MVERTPHQVAVSEGMKLHWRKRKRASPEFDLQKTVVQHIELRRKPNIYFTAIPVGELRTKATAGKLKAMGVKAGAPDLLIIVNGIANGLELKADKNGRLSPDQLETMNAWEKAGGRYWCARGLDDALKRLVFIGAIYPEGVRNANAA